MKTIIALKSCHYAHNDKPWLPLVFLKEKETYDIDGVNITIALADQIVENGNAEFCEQEEDTQKSDSVKSEEFDPRAASYEEMKEYVKANEELDDLIDLRISEEDLRIELVGLLESGE